MTEQGNNRSDECIIETVEQKEKVIGEIVRKPNGEIVLRFF